MNFPKQESSFQTLKNRNNLQDFDMRKYLSPNRLTVIMWDYTYLTRHMNGESFEDYDAVIDQAIENGYNTIRIDPLPHVIDLMNPNTVNSRESLYEQKYHPWDTPKAFKGSLGSYLMEFIEKIKSKNLYYCLSGWFFPFVGCPRPNSLIETVPQWIKLLSDWKEIFGFENCVYVDLANEYPYFLNNRLETSIRENGPRWSDGWNRAIRDEVNSCLKKMRNYFPELRFTVSLHGDIHWIDVGLELDVMDIHFYADADNRFNDRTNFDINYNAFFKTDKLYKDFSDRCTKSHKAMAPMYRARQRSNLSAFVDWSKVSGTPLITTESWASWFYTDHQDLDWEWLLEWSQWSVEDAIDYKMWGGLLIIIVNPNLRIGKRRIGINP